MINANESNCLGHYEINNTDFIGLFGYEGVILYVEETNNNTIVTFNNSSFKENFTLNRGGIVFSQSNSTNLYVSFNDCIFEDNWCSDGIKNII